MTAHEPSQDRPTTPDRSNQGPSRPPFTPENCKRAFDAAKHVLPWTVAYESVAADFAPRTLNVEGEWPDDVRGVLFRNGPAKHERGAQRYGHRWDGDGMVHRFDLSASPSHAARFVRTPKFVHEEAAGRLSHNAFGTYFDGTPALPENIDDCNAANISVVCTRTDELLALWEPGSAVVVDPVTLQTRGFKVWSEATRARAFSAHPKREPGGRLWNFGAEPLEARLNVYAIGADGVLDHARSIDVPDLPNVHDFAVTENHLVFLLPPTPTNRHKLESGMSYAHAVEWMPSLGTRVLVTSKTSAQTRAYQLPPLAIFHLSNAWEEGDGTIHLEFFGTPNPATMMAGWTIMQGVYRHMPGATLHLLTLPADGQARLTPVPIEGEFPTVDPSTVGKRHEWVTFVGRGADVPQDRPGYNELCGYRMVDGSVDRYVFAGDAMVEEHLQVPSSRDPRGPARWVVGLSLDLRTARSALNVFRLGELHRGPVARALLPYALPMGLHGAYTAE